MSLRLSPCRISRPQRPKGKAGECSRPLDPKSTQSLRFHTSAFTSSPKLCLSVASIKQRTTHLLACPVSVRAPFSLQTPVERSERVAGCWAVRARAHPLSLGVWHFTLRFVLPGSWVGNPALPPGCDMQSPSGPKVYPKSTQHGGSGVCGVHSMRTTALRPVNLG